jgi:chromosome segregation ATPase
VRVTDANQIQADLERAVADREERARLARRLEAAQPHLTQLEARVEELRRKLGDEAADVERLESFSTARIWAQLKGSHASDLERETAEREAARYAVAEAEARLESMRRDLAALESRLGELGDTDRRYRDALAVKETWLRETGSTVTESLAEIAERRGHLQAVDAEMREAHQAGRAAHDLLAHASSLLGSAGSWSTWDAFGGGGLLTDMMKYDKVNQATEALRRADGALTRFSRELADVALPSVQGVQVDQLMRTFDVWFDNIFSDLAVRSRIQDAGQRVSGAIVQVERALTALAERGHELQRELAELDRRREELVRA